MIDKVFSICIIMLPILYQYKSPIPSIAFGEFILIPFIVYYFCISCTQKKKVYIDFKLLLFLYIVLLTTLISGSFEPYFQISKSNTIIMRMIFYNILIFFTFNYFNFPYAMRIYNNIVIILSVYLIIQYIYTNLTHDYLPIYLNYDWLFAPEQRAKSLKLNYQFIFRPSSLFLEPSYFTLYSIPAVGYNLLYFKNNLNFRKLKAILITIALVASTSSAGIVAAILIWIFNSWPTVRKDSTLQRLLLVMCIIVVTIFLYRTPMAQSGIQRTLSGGSIGQRILRGVIIYKEINLFNKLFGIGLNNLSNYMNYYRINTLYDEANLNYLAGFIGICVNSGIISLVFFLNYISSLLRKQRNKLTLLFIILFAFCSIYENMLFSYRMGFYLIIIYGSLSYQPEQEHDKTGYLKEIDKNV